MTGQTRRAVKASVVSVTLAALLCSYSYSAAAGRDPRSALAPGRQDPVIAAAPTATPPAPMLVDEPCHAAAHVAPYKPGSRVINAAPAKRTAPSTVLAGQRIESCATAGAPVAA